MIDQHIQRHLESATSLDDIAKHLAMLLTTGVSVWEQEDGTSIFCYGRAKVDQIDGIKIIIRNNEHAPPHFHVIANGVDASFRIDTGQYLSGDIDSRRRKIVEHYWELAQERLIKFWNDTRPGDCTVGQYVMST
jgi:hypothetical protein